MRTGLLIGEPSGPGALNELRDRLAKAADDGFASAWLSNIFGLDALTALAVAGSQVPGIELGTAVVPTYPRHPIALAQQALTVNAALGGRLTLGIGLSHKVVIEGVFGLGFDRPARHMREYLTALGPLLASEQTDVDGETLRAHIRLSTPTSGAPPVLVAALGPRLLKIAGELADGTVLWMTGPATVAGHIAPEINAAAAAAGRPAPRVVCALPVCVTGDAGEARARAARIFKMYGELPSYRAMLDREGAAGPADVALIGDEDAVAARVDALAKAGVTDFVASVFTRDDTRTAAFLRSLL
ncbi:LLM class F420-dependent oxidoreductase [Spongiactinospora sp. TRM90649]|uniref:LLM class F420-dependent oxidoreductase n=1 Tax=Spongiactinospora sp. TRM90649 TaxID=3031114 RepID=UPI0023F9BB54|nr:LLM class F420-dependent oxidoreductase [Spongiactinospora sp. TRM90649]MDF5756732.1 LLM class F420-dependent oxidoreductase [Spongiactinospora sp. TRM90649]